MKNTMLPENINEKVKVLREVITDLVECSRPDPEKTEKASDLEKVHNMSYLKAMGSLIESSLAIEFLVKDVSEEEFEKFMTDDGAKTIEEVKKDMMFSMAMEALSR